MKILYKGLYLYLGWNGIIFCLDFQFRKKWHSIDFTLTHYGEDEDET